MKGFTARSLAFVALFALALGAAAAPAQARIGGGFSFGSRGGRTFSMPAPTPFGGRAAPIGRSMTPNLQRSPTAPSYGYRGFGGGFGGGLGRGFLGGLLGAGLLGLFFGHGFFGGMGGAGSLFGLILQLALIYFLVRLAMRWFSGAQPGFAGGMFRSVQGGFPGGGFAPASAYGAPASSGQPIQLSGEDFNAFEWLLQESQTAFGAEDLDRLRRISTPEMASYFAEQIAQNARRGQVNKIADVRLLKGDLSEAWREASGDYATVSLRFSLLDWTVDRQSGQVVEGDSRNPQEALEYWTFRREPGTGARGWTISAIQQAQG